MSGYRPLSFTPDGLARMFENLRTDVEQLKRYRAPVINLDEQEDDDGGGGVAVNAGEILVLSGTADSIASGGDYLTAGAITRQIGFAGIPSAGAPIALPRTAVYNVELHFAWDSYDGGGTVELEINGLTRRVHPDNGTGTRFEWTAVIDATANEVLKVKVSHDDVSAQPATWEMTVAAVEPISTSALDALVLFGYDAEAGGTSSVTISGNAEIEPGDLLVAFLASAEPDITSPPEFTFVTGEVIGDEQYEVQYRIATAGDDTASWTWTAGGGAAPDKSLAITVVIVKGPAALDGTPGYDREESGTSLVNATTMAAAGRLLLATKSTGGALSVAGMTAVFQTNETSNDGAVYTHGLYVADAAAGAHSITSTAGSAGTLQAYLVGVS